MRHGETSSKTKNFVSIRSENDGASCWIEAALVSRSENRRRRMLVRVDRGGGIVGGRFLFLFLYFSLSLSFSLSWRGKCFEKRLNAIRVTTKP